MSILEISYNIILWALAEDICQYGFWFIIFCGDSSDFDIYFETYFKYKNSFEAY